MSVEVGLQSLSIIVIIAMAVVGGLITIIFALLKFVFADIKNKICTFQDNLNEHEKREEAQYIQFSDRIQELKTEIFTSDKILSRKRK